MALPQQNCMEQLLSHVAFRENIELQYRANISADVLGSPASIDGLFRVTSNFIKTNFKTKQMSQKKSYYTDNITFIPIILNRFEL